MAVFQMSSHCSGMGVAGGGDVAGVEFSTPTDFGDLYGEVEPDSSTTEAPC